MLISDSSTQNNFFITSNDLQIQPKNFFNTMTLFFFLYKILKIIKYGFNLNHVRCLLGHLSAPWHFRFTFMSLPLSIRWAKWRFEFIPFPVQLCDFCVSPSSPPALSIFSLRSYISQILITSGTRFDEILFKSTSRLSDHLCWEKFVQPTCAFKI